MPTLPLYRALGSPPSEGNLRFVVEAISAPSVERITCNIRQHACEQIWVGSVERVAHLGERVEVLAPPAYQKVCTVPPYQPNSRPEVVIEFPATDLGLAKQILRVIQDRFNCWHHGPLGCEIS